MRLANTALAVACLAFSTVVHAQQFSIVSGDLHAQATVTGVPPVKDMPADVILGPAQAQGSVQAQANAPVPETAVGSFSSGGGVSLNSASFSIGGHSTGSNGVVGRPIGTGSGSFDVIFSLDAPAEVHFHGSRTPVIAFDLVTSESLTSDGNVVAPLTFDGSGNLDFFQALNPGSYELAGSGSVDAGAGIGAGGTENLTATIVPEPVGGSILLISMIPIGLRLRRKSRRII